MSRGSGLKALAVRAGVKPFGKNVAITARSGNQPERVSADWVAPNPYKYDDRLDVWMRVEKAEAMRAATEAKRAAEEAKREKQRRELEERRIEEVRVATLEDWGDF